MDIAYSDYGRASITPAPVNRLMTQFAHDFRDGIDINLGVGYVNENTIPVDHIREALDVVAGDPARYRQAFNYGSAAGSANLVAALRRVLAGRSGLDEATLARNRLAIGACGATSILDSLARVFEPGIVITSDPSYYIYTDALERCGFDILAIPEDAEGIDLAILERKLAGLGRDRGRIAFLYVVTVNNPSCTVLSNGRRRALYDVAARLSAEQGRAIPIFYDAAYELLLHDPKAEPFASVLPDDDLHLAYEIGTLSKILAPALRIGYILGPGGPLIDALVQRTSDAGFSAPLFVQEMAGYLLESRVEAQVRAVNDGYRTKALATKRAIENGLGPLLEEMRGGSAGFYYYLTFRDIATHPRSRFFEFLTRTTGDPVVDGPPGSRRRRVMYIPGSYCVHAKGDLAETGRRQLRLSYGFENAGSIEEAIGFMRDAAKSASVSGTVAAR